MLNFTVGPVQSCDEILSIGGEQIPYFRTSEFSEIMTENESLMKKFCFAPSGSRAIFLTGSGTAAMEAAVMNIFDSSDKVLVVNGGSFGARFAALCQIHGISCTEIIPDFGKSVSKDDLKPFEAAGYTGFLVNACETSTGVLHDLNLISEFCKRNNIRLVVDAISAFLADDINMEALEISALLTGSQKALALPPGISIIVMNEKTVTGIMNKNIRSMYFDLKSCLKNGERGQTPFTPAVGILLQMNKRLKMIDTDGVEAEREKIAVIAKDFRKKIQALPFEITSHALSNAVTPLSHTGGASAYKIFEILKDEYNIFVCPNGGALADKLFRVGHIGALTKKDNDILISALNDIKKRGII